jgi:hypothetical protein
MLFVGDYVKHQTRPIFRKCVGLGRNAGESTGNKAYENLYNK